MLSNMIKKHQWIVTALILSAMIMLPLTHANAFDQEQCTAEVSKYFGLMKKLDTAGDELIQAIKDAARDIRIDDQEVDQLAGHIKRFMRDNAISEDDARKLEKYEDKSAQTNWDAGVLVRKVKIYENIEQKAQRVLDRALSGPCKH